MSCILFEGLCVLCTGPHKCGEVVHGTSGRQTRLGNKLVVVVVVAFDK